MLQEIGNALNDAESVFIFPHIGIDGDSAGSSVALCHALRQHGKEAYVLLEEPLPDDLTFLDRGYCTMDETRIAGADLCICVDCGEESRFPGRVEAFHKGSVTACIDHHPTTEEYADINYIDPSAAATGEIVYDLLTGLGWDIDKETGEALFAAITTDTGNFQYSNTTRRTHEITAALYDSGMDHNAVSIELYENIKFSKLVLSGRVLGASEIFADGRGIIAHVTQEMLRETGAAMDETTGIVASMRSIAGVEVSALLKETADGRIRVSMRSKKHADVSEIAQRHDGGGHAKAAGCTLHCPMAEAIGVIRQEISDILD